MNTQVQTKINELKELILEMRKEGYNKVADLVADELQTLLANEELVGNNPMRS